MVPTWRPLAAWPYPPRPRGSARFRVGWNQTIRDLGDEIERTGGSEVVIGVVADPSQFTFDGRLRANAKIDHNGVEVSFERGDRRLVFHTDAYGSLQENLRAITLGLEALRAVDRYGITSTAEQYAGFAALPPGGADAERGRALVERAGGMTEALKRYHPDHGGDDRDFIDVQAYRKTVAAAAR